MQLKTLWHFAKWAAVQPAMLSVATRICQSHLKRERARCGKALSYLVGVGFFLVRRRHDFAEDGELVDAVLQDRGDVYSLHASQHPDGPESGLTQEIQELNKVQIFNGKCA